MNYSIIIPLLNEEEGLEMFHKELIDVINELKNNRNIEIIYIDDGSLDNTFEKLLSFKKENSNITIIKHKKNLSQSISIFHGIINSKFDNLIFLDGDGQNDPKDILKMLNEFEKGYDLVHGYRKNRTYI